MVNTAPGRLEMLDWPVPAPGPGQVFVRVAACGICATDLEMIAGWERTGFPAIPGHEWSGIVEGVGPGVDAAIIGRPCVGDNVWADGGEVGFEHPGGYAEFLVTEARNLQFLPTDFPLTVAALFEPLAVCLRAVRRLHLENLDSALVFGDGGIGLIMLILLKLKQVKQVSLVGGRPARLAAAKEFGAVETINYHDAGENLPAPIKALPGAPFANIVEASGSPASLRAAISIAAQCGKILIVGDYRAARADFSWLYAQTHELDIIGSNASAGAWEEAVQLAPTIRPALERLVSRTIPASSYAAGIELARSARDVIKVIINWQA